MEHSPLTPSTVDIEQLVVDHLPLVAHLVREIARRIPTSVDRDDLASAGQLALVQASRSWEPERGVPFAAYATTRIRGALVDELRTQDWASRSVRRRSREIDAERTRLASAGTGLAADRVVAKRLGLSVEDVARSDRDVQRAAVVPLEQDGGGTAQALISALPDPESSFEQTETLQYLVCAIAQLPERLRHVIREYFLEERPMTELAVELGVSECRVSQMRAEAMVLLREALDQAFEADRSAPVPIAGRGGVKARRQQAYVQSVAADHAVRYPRRTPVAVAV
jgi:RNA polymerase sigma factor FliA